MNSATEHLKALLINDGREFAMVRKSDLAALVQIAETNPHQGRWLDSLSDSHRVINALRGRDTGLCKRIVDLEADTRKHGEERRRYMANNKALLARVDDLEHEVEAHSEDLSRVGVEYCEELIKRDPLRTALREAIRKAPATCRLLGLTK